MKDSYDFSDAVKNPFAGRIKGKYTVTVYYDFSEEQTTLDINKNNSSSGETIIFDRYRHSKTLRTQ